MARRIQPNPGIVSFLFLILAALHLNAQVTLTQADMPAVNDTFRISTAVDISGQDPSLTGAAYTWDYSGLSALSQTLDTFLPMSTVPALYQLFFNNPLDPNKANLARKMPMLNLIPGFEIGDVYEFYRNNAQSFSFLGYAGELSGIPLAVKYDQPDVWYRFPLNFGAHGSSRSVFSLSLPGLGSFYSDRKRWNTVDGWGQLSTPFGTFQVLRQRSEVEEY
ncbi:MAG TPA: hypothetical protein P5248_13255, partial [Bacteroidales bacterium]|nr:hypothetical protein [Bacteroidales bacterium]